MDHAPATAGLAAAELLPSPLQRKAALAMCGALLLAGIGLTPLASIALPAAPGYMSAFGAAMLVANLLLAALLFSRGATEQRAATICLGSAYFFVGAIFVPLLLAFPDALVAGALIGDPDSPVWLWSFWHAGFGLAILRYVWVQRRPRKPTRVRHEIAAVLLLVAGLSWLATEGPAGLPQLLANGRRFFAGRQQLIPCAILAIDLLTLLRIARLPRLGPEQLWLGVAMLAACIDVWLTFLGTDRFSLGWFAAKLCSLGTTLAVLVSLFHDLTALYGRVSQANAVLAGLARQDGLTGLANRRRFDEALADEWSRAFRVDKPLALLMIDVDFFKNYNDRHGHAEGDHCLRLVAELTRACTRRPGDVAARYGGEEFALILPGTDAAGALALAALLRRQLINQALPHAESPTGRLTVSIGIALAHPLQSGPLDLLRAADDALYRAKAEGRDRACLAPEPETEPSASAIWQRTGGGPGP